MKRRSLKAISAVVLLLLQGGCSTKQKPGASSPIAEQHFSSPALAADELNRAVQADDRAALAKLFGPDGESLLNSGDSVADENALKDFAAKMSEKYSVEAKADGEYEILVGDKEWPFPIPLVKDGNSWAFDTSEGIQEILNRRIGKNELKTIRSTVTFVEAEKEYYNRSRTMNGVRSYAKKFGSSPGKRDGLFWKSNNPKDQSPLGPLAAEAVAEGYRKNSTEPVPFHGYIYKMLHQQGDDAPGGQKSYLDKNGNMTGGFAMLAYPARWGTSGIVSFIVNQDGVVYEKDLGIQTVAIAEEMKEFNPDPSWEPVPESDENVLD